MHIRIECQRCPQQIFEASAGLRFFLWMLAWFLRFWLPIFLFLPARSVLSQYPVQLPPAEPETVVLGPSEPVVYLGGEGEESSSNNSAEPRISTLLAQPIRPGMFQRLIWHHTWLAPGGSEEIGFFQSELKSVWGLPFPTVQSPLVLTPGFGTYWLEGPEVVELPPRLFDLYLQARWLPTLAPRWKLDLAVTPGLYGDMEFCNSSTFRLASHAVVVFQWSPVLILSAGIAYLDREDVNLVPVAGVVWQAREDWVFELLLPRPRVAKRVDWGWLQRPQAENWLYVGGEFGGGTWSVDLPATGRDVVTYRDFRLLVGIEQRAPLRLSWRAEAGYVFGRKLTYENLSARLHPDDSVVVRLSLTY